LTKLLQTLVDAISVGSLYALIALGYTMVYGILQFINFAHSDVFMMGAWFSYLVSRAAGWTVSTPPSWSLPMVLLTVMVICGALGFTIERLAYRPLRRAPRLNVLITAIGVSLFLENTGQLRWLFGTQPQPMPRLVVDRPLLTVGSTGADGLSFAVNINLIDVMVVVVAVVLMLALQWLVYSTKLGRAMRAVSFDTRTAALMGINVDAVVSATFVIGSSLAAAAGLLFGLKYYGLKQPADTTWILLGLKAFVAAVIGGIGNIRGAMLGGLLIGAVELFGASYLSPHLRDVYVFSLLIGVLLLRPTGLLGRATVEKV
jgi:branched-chain amino acid transport system permease protein